MPINGNYPTALLDLSLCEETLGFLSRNVASLLGRGYPRVPCLGSLEPDHSCTFQATNIEGGPSHTLYLMVYHYVLHMVKRNAIIFNEPERTLDVLCLRKRINRSFQRHWVSFLRLAPPNGKNHACRLHKLLINYIYVFCSIMDPNS